MAGLLSRPDFHRAFHTSLATISSSSVSQSRIFDIHKPLALLPILMRFEYQFSFYIFVNLLALFLFDTVYSPKLGFKLKLPLNYMKYTQFQWI